MRGGDLPWIGLFVTIKVFFARMMLAKIVPVGSLLARLTVEP